ncbi:MAG: TIGR03435 family protein [Acidobacteriaceae bacterium]
MTMRIARRLKLIGKLMLSVAILGVAVPIAFGLVALAQSHAEPQVKDSATKQDTGVKAPAFDFVTVKPGTYMSGMGMRIGTTPNSFSATNISLGSLILNAYGLQMEDLISGLPGWAKSARFDIEAKMDAETAAAYKKLSRQERFEQDQSMMQSLLRDRFDLKVHHATKELPIYALVIAKGGSKLKPSTTRQGWGTDGPGRIDYRNAELEALVVSLSGEVGRMVVDETGLSGKYDFTLKWTPDEQRGMADAGPSIFTALQEQLGLKLISTKGPVDTIVVDHVDRPSPN